MFFEDDPPTEREEPGEVCTEGVREREEEALFPPKAQPFQQASHQGPVNSSFHMSVMG